MKLSGSVLLRILAAAGLAGPVGLVLLSGNTDLSHADLRQATGLVRNTDYSGNYADEQSCIECHEQAEYFPLTGHARTLRRADDEAVLKALFALNDSAAAAAEGVQVVGEGSDIRLIRSDEQPAVSGKADWCFGSGTHARTWVGVLPDALGECDILEYRWTWLAESDEFGLTPGQPATHAPTATGRLGLLFDGPRARRCFHCHSTVDQTADGRSFSERIHPGVTCQRCHGARADHVRTAGAAGAVSPAALSREDSVLLCAECHRRAEDQKPESVRADNPDIARFQSVGLSQSRCFTMTEMTCVSCHDPHLPMSMQDSARDSQCTQCHSGDAAAEHRTSGCLAGHTADCVACHMPRVETAPGLRFADHWIRVHPETERRQDDRP